MRGPRTALIAAVVVTAATATISQSPADVRRSAEVAASAAAARLRSDPSLATRSARQLLRNGLDYLDTYQDYDRALRLPPRGRSRGPVGLDEAEIKSLADGLDRAETARRGRIATGARRRSALRRRRSGPWPAVPAARSVAAGGIGVEAEPVQPGLGRDGRAGRAAPALDLPGSSRRRPPPPRPARRPAGSRRRRPSARPNRPWPWRSSSPGRRRPRQRLAAAAGRPRPPSRPPSRSS